MLLMMSANRINHANLALQQSRTVLKLLKVLHSTSLSPTVSERTTKELLSQSENLATTLSSKRHFAERISGDLFEIDPRFLLFEYCHGLLLRQSQILLVRRLLSDMTEGKSVCHQMIMGAGKTTVVGPLLALLLANAKTLMFEVVPPALLDFSAGVLRERFSGAITKPVFTFSFDRYNSVTPSLLAKLQTARNLRAVVVSTPSSVKSFMLKFLEICHNLSRQKSVLLEQKEKKSIESTFSQVRALLGLSGKKTLTSGELSKEEISQQRDQAVIGDQIFDIFRGSVEIMDEVDIILHPLKSELNWPLGAKDPLDFTRTRSSKGLRWSIPNHLLDAILSCCGMPIVAEIADSRSSSESFLPFCVLCITSFFFAVAILEELEAIINKGFDTLQIQRTPHLALVSKNFYE
jgi:hypothetical protein